MARQVCWNCRSRSLAGLQLPFVSTSSQFEPFHLDLSQPATSPFTDTSITIQCLLSTTPPHRAWASTTRSTPCQQDGSYREYCSCGSTVVNRCSSAGSRIGWLHSGGQSRERRSQPLGRTTMPCVDLSTARTGLTDTCGVDAKRIMGENRRQDPGRCKSMKTDL